MSNKNRNVILMLSIIVSYKFKKPSRENFTKQFFVSITFDLVSLWKSYNFANAALTELIKQIVSP